MGRIRGYACGLRCETPTSPASLNVRDANLWTSSFVFVGRSLLDGRRPGAGVCPAEIRTVAMEISTEAGSDFLSLVVAVGGRET